MKILRNEKFKDSDDLNKQVKILDEIEDDLKIPKEKNAKDILQNPNFLKMFKKFISLYSKLL
jgi:hypothetical protein